VLPGHEPHASQSGTKAMNLFPAGKFSNAHSERSGNAFPEALGYQTENNHDDP
jgi:hypothetical protein